MILNDFNYLNKILTLKDMGYNVIENTEFEILEENTDTNDADMVQSEKYAVDYTL